MKRLLIGVYLFSIALLFSACTALPESGGVSYISSQSYVSGDKYSLCFENTTEKALEFCIYGVFRDNNRAVGLDENGIMKKGVIIRHLVLPNHTKNSIGVLDIINDNFKNTPVSLMGQYVPVYKAEEYSKLSRKITKREYNKVKNYMVELGLNGFSQELSSADEAFIPDWDYK